MQESALEFIETRYFTPDDFTREFGIWPIGVGRNIAKPNYSTKPRALEHCSIHFVIECKVEVIYGTNRIVLSILGDPLRLQGFAMAGNWLEGMPFDPAQEERALMNAFRLGELAGRSLLSY